MQFLPIGDKKEAFYLLREAAKGLATTRIWTGDQVVQFEAKMTHVCSVEERIGFLPPNPTKQGPFRPDPAQEYFFMLSVASACLFFKTRFKNSLPNLMKFQLPEAVFRVQRRKFLRLHVPQGTSLKLAYDDPARPLGEKITRKIIDLSGGGIAFFVPGNLAGSIEAGQILSNVTFTAGNRVYKTRTEVRHRLEVNHVVYKTGFKVGCKFLDLSPEQTQALDAHINQELRKHFPKMFA